MNNELRNYIAGVYEKYTLCGKEKAYKMANSWIEHINYGYVFPVTILHYFIIFKIWERGIDIHPCFNYPITISRELMNYIAWKHYYYITQQKKGKINRWNTHYQNTQTQSNEN